MDRNEKKFAWNFIFESDLIEGLCNNRRQLRDEILDIKNDGHVGSFFIMHDLAEQRSILNELVVFNIQKMLCLEQPLKGGQGIKEMFLGRYRIVNVSVVSDTPIFLEGRVVKQRKILQTSPAPELVPGLMKEWIERVNEWQKNISQFSPEKNAEIISDFHFEYEKIHPFVDGNGRTGRLLAYFMLQYAKLQPFIFWEWSKHIDYYPAFASKEKMREYFFIRIFHQEKIMGRVESLTEDEIITF